MSYHHTCMYVHMRVLACMHVSVCFHVHGCVRAGIRIDMSVVVCIPARMCVRAHTWVYFSVCVRVPVCIHVVAYRPINAPCRYLHQCFRAVCACVRTCKLLTLEIFKSETLRNVTGLRINLLTLTCMQWELSSAVQPPDEVWLTFYDWPYGLQVVVPTEAMHLTRHATRES